MKNIFKKNQVIITALAIMIALAGYLTFTRDKEPSKDGTEIVKEAVNPDLEDYDVYTELGDELAAEEGTEVAQSTTTDTDADTTDTTDTGVLEDAETAVDDDEKAATTGLDAEENETTAISGEEGGELGEISDEDIEAAQIDVNDAGELEINSESDEVVGEAVLASTSIDAGYFSSAKLNREIARSKVRADYKEIMDNSSISEDQKTKAIENMILMTGIIEKESAAEVLLEAKGFDGVVVYIVNGVADVIINAENITDQELAIIEDAVKRKTDLDAEHIVINPVVVTE